MQASYSPRIYCADAALIDNGAWPALIERVAKLGFDHLLIAAAPDARGGASARAGNGALSLEQLHAIAEASTAAHLRLLLELSIDAVDGDDPIASRYADGFVPVHPGPDNGALPDPRFPPGMPSRLLPHWENESLAQQLLKEFTARLTPLLDAGVAGFLCLLAPSVSAQRWCKLIAATREQRPCCDFLAWTPGTPTARLEQLSECGFDAMFSSAAWWDLRASWYYREHAALALLAAPVAFPESPYGPRLAHRLDLTDAAQRQNAARRALQLSAATGSGILVPMGFEHGLAQPLAVSGLPGALRDPDDYRRACEAGIDLQNDLVTANQLLQKIGPTAREAALRPLTGGDAGVVLMVRSEPRGDAESSPEMLIAINTRLTQTARLDDSWLRERLAGREPLLFKQDDEPFELAPAAVSIWNLQQPAAIVTAPARRKKGVIEAGMRGDRIAIENVTPTVPGGDFAVKRVVGESVEVQADILMDGHDKLAADVLWRAADEKEWHRVPMHLLVNDRWSARLPLSRMGRHVFCVEAWYDDFATYRYELTKKTEAGLDVTLEIEEGRLHLVRAAEHAKLHGRDDVAAALAPQIALIAPYKRAVKPKRTRAGADAVHEAKTDADADAHAHNAAASIAILLDAGTARTMQEAATRPFATRSAPQTIDAQRIAARFSSWYELFPRSQSGDTARHGNFDDVIARLPAIQAMGFDTLYFPPIHPIGKKNRKGKNNTLTPSDTDPGSPYAIGDASGGHDAIHPELGTFEDFRRLRVEAARHGLEIALDFAIQCSPDHPWLKQHPGWFDWRPDGSIRYAENPPKKYEDIVNVDFYADDAIPELWLALRDVVLFWAGEGVRTFRVDNPHTKPLPFWQWMIGTVQSRFPDAIFLSEAFTAPKMMYRLAKVGFTQSYTYFTWRHRKHEFVDYLTELTTTEVREYFRPHFFVNTPDINPRFLQESGRSGFLIRAALATTLSGLWGMYSGFELCEAEPVPGKEDYLNSEKYEIRAWDWQRPGNIIAEITQLNRIRIENPALQSHLGLRFYQASNDNVLYFAKTTPAAEGTGFGDNVVLVAICLDPWNSQGFNFELPLWEFGLPDHGRVKVEDLVHGTRFEWQGKFQNWTLHPHELPYAIWRIEPNGV